MAPPPRLVEVVADDGLIRLVWSDGLRDAVTATWLRDACHCPECRVDVGGQRRVDLGALDPRCGVDRVTVDPDGVAVCFTDGHTGRVPSEVVAVRRPRPEPTRWGAGHAERLRAEIACADGDLQSFLAALDRDGVALAEGLRRRRGEVGRFAERIGYIRETNYGRVFDVAVEPDPANLANSAAALPLHTDNPYREPVPTVQVLHCLSASGFGGTTRLVDGWAAAERLAVTDPRAFDLLTTREVPFRFVDEGVDLRARARLIELDAAGEVVAVRVNSRSMQPPDLPVEDIEPFYAAYRSFTEALADPSAVAELTLGPGELLAFDNRRVLHGRSVYPADSGRLLQGCYVDIDAIRSSVRVRSAASA